MLFVTSPTRHRERHAKTLEIAQEEVLTCIGMFIYERLRRVHLCLKEEENAVQVLAAVAAHTLCRSFDTAVEQKRGISNLELLYQEISRAERAKKARQELKKLKKKLKKGDRQRHRLAEAEESAGADNEGAEDEDEEEEEDNSMAEEVCQLFDSTRDCCGGFTDAVHNAFEAAVAACLRAAEEQGYNTEELDTASQCCSEFNDAAGEESGPCCGRDANAKAPPARATDGTTTRTAQCTCSSSTCSNLSDASAVVASLLTAADAKGVAADGGTLDAGYGSEATMSLLSSLQSSLTSSPDGSEVACSDGFCKHLPEAAHGRGTMSTSPVHCRRSEPQLTLEQMLVSGCYVVTCG